MAEKPSAPRQHHIIPAFYLAGFTDSGAADGQLHVYDYFLTKHYRSTPRQACRQRDFYRIHEPGEDPYLYEKLMAKAENELAPKIRAAVAANKITDREQVGAALSLAAMIQARNRRGRYTISRGLAESLTEYLAAGKIPREKWDAIRGAEMRAGVDPRALPEDDEARRLIAAGEWAPSAPQILQVGLIFEGAAVYEEHLANRRWELMHTDPAGGGFITSDSPLMWGSVADAIRDRYISATLDDPYIEITFPLSKSLALVSYPGARESNFSATPEVVAHINSRTHLASTGLLFHCAPDFTMTRNSGEIAWASDYFAFVKRARRHGIVRP